MNNLYSTSPVDLFNNQLYYNLINKATAVKAKVRGVKAEALLITPHSNPPISDQISTTTIKGLPDNQILKDEYFEIFTGLNANRVKAKADGTFVTALATRSLQQYQYSLAYKGKWSYI